MKDSDKENQKELPQQQKINQQVPECSTNTKLRNTTIENNPDQHYNPEI